MKNNLKNHEDNYWHIKKISKRFFWISILTLFWWYISIGTLALIVTTIKPFEKGWYGIGATLMVFVLTVSLIGIPVVLNLVIKNKKK